MTITVKCLTATEKDQICLAYNAKNLNLRELATHFNTSTRTIGRVLEERGLATPVPRLKGEAYQAMVLLRDFGVSIPELRTMLAKGHANRVTPEMAAVMSFLAEYRLDLDSLKAALATPTLSPENVQNYLNQCTKQHLATHFYVSGLIKLAEIDQQMKNDAHQAQLAAVPA